ncbi:MAG: hypothetical protein KC561_15995 [Myxococcales bacterium]|nr:hypothetical protein [Myxococcales bacterium]
MTRYLLLLGTCVALIGACDKGDSDSTTEPGGGAAQAEATEAPEASPAPCEFIRASRSLASVTVETADRSCSLVLPLEVSAGSLGVAVSVAGQTDVGAVEIRSGDDGFYYANQGTIEVTVVDETHIAGQFTVSDTTPPGEGGPWTGTFNVPFE